MSKVKVGDFFDDGTLTQITRIDEYRAYYNTSNVEAWVDLEYAYNHRISAFIEESSAITPSHYNSTSITALQVIDDWNLDFYLGNTVKYIARAKLKGKEIEDLEKGLKYLQLYISKLKNAKTED